MKNKEKFAKEIIEIACDGNSIAVVKLTGELRPCCEISCGECLFRSGTNRCTKKTREWAEAEYVELPVISKRDRAFLDYIGNTYKYVLRDNDGKLFACKNAHAVNDEWFSVSSDYTYISGFDLQFPMVKHVSPIVWSIKDLKNLEVVEEYGKQ